MLFILLTHTDPQGTASLVLSQQVERLRSDSKAIRGSYADILEAKDRQIKRLSALITSASPPGTQSASVQSLAVHTLVSQSPLSDAPIKPPPPKTAVSHGLSGPKESLAPPNHTHQNPMLSGYIPPHMRSAAQNSAARRLPSNNQTVSLPPHSQRSARTYTAHRPPSSYIPPHMRRITQNAPPLTAASESRTTATDAATTIRQSSFKSHTLADKVSVVRPPPSFASGEWRNAFTDVGITDILKDLCIKDIQGELWDERNCWWPDGSRICQDKYHICREWMKGQCRSESSTHQGPHGTTVVHVPRWCE